MGLFDKFKKKKERGELTPEDETSAVDEIDEEFSESETDEDISADIPEEDKVVTEDISESEIISEDGSGFAGRRLSPSKAPLRPRGRSRPCALPLRGAYRISPLRSPRRYPTE